MSDNGGSNSRRSIRFTPDLNTIGWIALKSAGETELPEIAALVVNESFKGCGLVFVHAEDIKTGTLAMVRVGKLSAQEARVVWIKKIDDCIHRAGFEYCT